MHQKIIPVRFLFRWKQSNFDRSLGAKGDSTATPRINFGEEFDASVDDDVDDDLDDDDGKDIATKSGLPYIWRKAVALNSGVYDTYFLKIEDCSKSSGLRGTRVSLR